MPGTEPEKQPAHDESKPRYEPPIIVAYDEASLLQMIGPAVACARWDKPSSDAGSGYGDTTGEWNPWHEEFGDWDYKASASPPWSRRKPYRRLPR
jgi:hypothetical protein